MSDSKRLVDLEATFIRLAPNGHQDVSKFSEAQGLCMICPCGEGHSLAIFFGARGVPSEVRPYARWDAFGSNIEDLTLSPSVNAHCWHGFIKNGRAEPC